MKRYLNIIIFIIALSVSGTAFARDVKFEVNLNRDKVALGESVQLGLSFYGTQTMPAPDLGNVDGIEVRYMGPSTMMTVMNGKVSTSITHMYRLLPLRIGKFQLGPFAFKYKADSYSSNMVFLEVSESGVVQKPAVSEEPEKLNLEDRIFLTLKSDKVSAYVNELVPITIKLYVNRLNVRDIQLPTFSQEGFSKVEFREPKQYREELGGLVYDVLEFRTNIFGTRPGDYRLGPAKIKATVLARRSSFKPPSSRDDFFGDDSFFEDLTARYENHPVELKSQDMHLIISPLPEDKRPKDYSGAVGDYQFIFDASPKKVKVGDPITVRMSINGTGNFNTVLSPKLDNFTGFKTYEAQVNTEENRKAFSQVFIPETEKATEIPGAAFSYFDPNKKEYITIKHNPIPIQVEKGSEEAAAPLISPISAGQKSEDKESLLRDIVYIKESPGRWVNKESRVYRGKIFSGLVIVPLVFIIALYIVQGRRNRIKNDSVYASRIAALRSAKVGLKKLKDQLKAQDVKSFYESLFKTLQGYMGNRLHMPPAGITSDVVEKALAAKDIDLSILNKIKDLFSVCDEARFALSSVDMFKIADDLKELEEVINYLERKKI